jgi:hypothetical protein
LFRELNQRLLVYAAATAKRFRKCGPRMLRLAAITGLFLRGGGGG